MSVLVDSYSESNEDQGVGIGYSSAGHSVGQSFTGDGSVLQSAKFYFKKENSPTGNCYAKVYAHSGTYGTSSVPTGSPLATSDAVDVSTVDTSYELVTFTFSGGDKITLTNGTKYCVVLNQPNDADGTNYTFVGFDSTSPTHDGNYFISDDTSWNYNASYDLCFYVYGDSSSESPSISPSASLSASLSPSLSPSISPSLSSSLSSSLSPSLSSSVSPSASLSASLSPSISASVSPTPSASLSPSISSSVSPSASLSASLSPSISASVSPTPSASLSPSLSPSLSASVSPSASATTYTNITVLINGTDRTDSIERNSLRIEDYLTRQINRCSFILRKYCSEHTYTPTVGLEVKVYLDDSLVFAGNIVKVTHSARDYKIIKLKVECNDYGRILGRKLLNSSYEEETVEDIIRSALSTLNTMDVLHNMDTYDGNGTWTVDAVNSDATNITTDSTTYKRGTGCVNFDVDVSQSTNHCAIIYNSDMTSVNLSEYDSNGYIFFWLYLPDSTNVESVGLRWGSSATDYWELTEARQHDHSQFEDGWNIMRFSWREAAQAGATGSPDSSALDYIRIKINFTGSQGDDTDFRVDDIVCGYIADLGVDCSITANWVAYRYEQFDNVLTQLADTVNYDWYVDYGRVINFFGKTDNTAPFDLSDTDGSYIFESLIVRRDNSQKKNVIYVRGGEYLGNALAPQYVSDGEQQVYALGYKYDDLLVTVTGTTWDGILEGQGDEDDYDYVWDREEKRLKFRNDRIPSDTSLITLHGRPYLPVRVKLSDQAVIDATKSAEGGDGEYEYVIVDQTINTKDGARDRARAELVAYKETLSEGEFETYNTGLRSGQRINVNSAAHNINEYFIINKVVMSPWTESAFKYKISVVTTKTLGIIEYLIWQTKRDKKEIIINPNEVLDLVEPYDEDITISESTSYSLSHNPQTESMSIAETVTAQSLNYDVEFVAGPYTPSGTKRVALAGGSHLTS